MQWSPLECPQHRVVCRDGRDARSVVPGHCGRLQLHKGLGRPGPRPLLGCYNPLPSRPDITSRTQLSNSFSMDLFSMREYSCVQERGVMNAVTQHVSLLLGATRCYENRECTLQILSESCNLNCFELRSADIGSAGSAAGGQNLNQSSRRRDAGGQGCAVTRPSSIIQI